MFRENPDKLCLCGITTVLFTGTEQNAFETSYYYLNSRYYDPEVAGGLMRMILEFCWKTRMIYYSKTFLLTV